MDIRSSLDGLKSMLGSAPAAPTAPQTAKSSPSAVGSAMGTDQATFSTAASEVSLTAADTGVRMDKVAGIQSALSAGSYNVPASAVAAKLVDSMLGGGQ